MFYAGIACGALTVLGVIGLAVYLIKRGDYMKKTSPIMYVIIIALIILGLASIALVFAGAAQKGLL